MCTECSSGFFSSTEGQSSCTQCDGSSWAVPGSSACVTCVQCGPGNYSYGCGTNDLEPGTCHSCPAGKFSDHADSNVKCHDCPPGLFQSKPGQVSCELCPAGNFSSSAGSLACEACATGKFAHTRGADECMLCDLGMFQDKTGESGCQSCATGKFSGKAGASECKRCISGKYAAKYSARECTACSPGTYQDHSGKSSCSLCRAGTFSSGNQSSECQACQPGTFAAQNGSQSCDACAAGSNSTWGAKTCIECERCEIDFFNTFCGLHGSDGTCEACALRRDSPGMKIVKPQTEQRLQWKAIAIAPVTEKTLTAGPPSRGRHQRHWRWLRTCSAASAWTYCTSA